MAVNALGRALLPLLLCACGTPQTDPRADEGPAPSPGPAPSLREISNHPLSGGYAALGLSGANKPNGLEYRLRRSVPASAPRFVPRRLGPLDLWIAEPASGGAWMGFYRSQLGLLPGDTNADFRAVLFGPGGERRWDLDLNRFLSRPNHLEIQDLRLHDGKLYFNEACQSYSREAGGECSSLVRVDPVAGRVDWRTRPLVSNDVFILRDPYVVVGYGFTSEPDSLFLVEQGTGALVASRALDSAHAYLELVDGRLVVVTRGRVYEMDFGAPAPAG